MAFPTPVQKNHYEGTSSEASKALAMPGASVVGNLLVVAYCYSLGSSSTTDPGITDNSGDGVTWNLCPKVCMSTTGSPDNQNWLGIAYKVAGHADTYTITVDPVNNAYISMQIFEWDTVAASPYDQHVEARLQTESVNIASGNSPNTTQDAELVFACNSYDGATTTITDIATGYTQIYSYETGDSYMPLDSACKEVAATGAQSATATLGSARRWAVCVATFKKDIAAPTAAIAGTATESINESNIVAGGKIITITLTGDTFIAS